MAGPAPILPLKHSRLPGAQRRTAILDAAIDLFSSRGFRGTTTREIAATVGVSEPVLYQHFATKRALFDAILQAKCDEVPVQTHEDLKRAFEAGDNRTFFTQLAAVYIDWYLNDPRYARLMMYATLEANELSQMFYERQVVAFYELVTSYLNQQITAGKIRPLDPILAARAFAGMISHQGLIYAIYKPGEIQGGREAVISTVVDIFLNGIENNDQ